MMCKKAAFQRRFLRRFLQFQPCRLSVPAKTHKCTVRLLIHFIFTAKIPVQSCFNDRMVTMSSLVRSKDSQWLQLDICREFQRNKCPRTDDCKYPHPPPHVEVVSGKVMACYDSFKGRCNREVCKYFHPPGHLTEQLLLKGRNHLAVKNAMVQHVPMMQPMFLPLPMEVPTMFPQENSGSTHVANKPETGVKRSADEISLESFYPALFCKRPAIEGIQFPFIPSVPYQPIFQFPAPAERKSHAIVEASC